MLSELVMRGPSLDTEQPLFVEALAVLAANTLLDSMVDAPFDGSWLYKTNNVQSPVKQQFMANIRISDYASGCTDPWQNVFMVVLAAVFVLNLAFFGYLLYISALRPCLLRLGRREPSRSGLKKDCTDLGELFQIALNSPQPMVGSPASVAQERGKLQSARWHFRNGPAARSPDGLDGICLAFDKEEKYGMVSPREDYFSSPKVPRLSPGRQGYRPYESLGFEEVIA